MSTRLTIGELSKSANIPVSTLRYYERVGLLGPESRSDGNYRIYGPAALKRLDFIRSAKDAGFTLEDIAALIGIRDNTTAACDEVRPLIEHRLAELDQRIKDLRQFKRTLAELRRICQESIDRDRCQVLGALRTGRRRA